MTMKARLFGIAVAAASLLAGDLFSARFDSFSLSYSSEAQARVGRPLTPGSVAGVARRTTRRVVRRSSIYVAALPAGCAVVGIDGVSYWRCGGTYYAASGGRYVVVYID